MSNSNFEQNSKIGTIGEQRVLFSILSSKKCWRYEHEYPCNKKHEHKYLAKECGKVDADILLYLNCQNCPYLKEGHEPRLTQLHEVKTNVATCDISENGRSSRTQNLYIELIQNIGAYENGKYDEEIDPLTGKPLRYRRGIGWWTKRNEAYSRRDTDINKAHWYHFYMPYDLGKSNEYKSTSQEDIDHWLNDPAIPENSTLITQWPVELCISVTGELLQEIIEEALNCGETKGNTLRSKKYPAYPIARLIPLKDIIACREANKHLSVDDPSVIETEGYPGVRTSIIGEFVQKSGNGTRVKTAIPMNTKVYSYKKIIGTGEDGLLLAYPLQPFNKAGYNPGNEKYVPKAIEYIMSLVIPYSL